MEKHCYFPFGRILRLRSALLAIFFTLGLGACAGSMPVPGGDEQVNNKAYKGQQDLLDRVAGLQIGMNQDLVLAMIKRERQELVRLDRPEIMAALYGGNGGGFDGTYEQQEQARLFLQSLDGYKLSFVERQKEHGFSSPIRVKTHETGYNYTLTMIFQNGMLFDKPTLSGGIVEGYSSKTVFDYLNPGNLLNMR